MRIGSVDVYKFIFSWVICFFHFYGILVPREHLILGATAVELFVLISGVFFFRSWEQQKQNIELGEQLSPYHFFAKRFARFFPVATIGFVISYIVRLIIYIADNGTISFSRIMSWLSGDIWEILLIKMNGLNNNGALLNTPAWTISAMLIVELVIAALLVNNEKCFDTLICPFIILFGFGFWRHAENTAYDTWIGITTFGVFRVFLATCLAWYCNKLVNQMRQINFTKLAKVVLTVIELFLLAFALFVIMSDYSSRNMRFFLIFIFFFVVAITMSGASYTTKIFPAGKVTSYLAELSMGIYLIHRPLLRVFRRYWSTADELFEHTFLFIVAVVISAILFCILVRLTLKIVGMLYVRIKPKLVHTA